MQTLHSAKLGLMAQQNRMSVVANNMANVNTPGFKRSRVVFQDTLYQAMRGGAARRDELGSYKTSTAVNDERSYWPYEGEYWRDELGTYEYTLTKGCRKTKQE